ncbi:MAG: tetratricopeptide repeat protein [Verrucomicrobiales bacterium]
MSGFRRGLFVPVAEQGGGLLAQNESLPIAGAVAVSLSSMGEFEKARSLMSRAESAGEPDLVLHRLLVDAYVARGSDDLKAELDACNSALVENDRHPLPPFLLSEAAYNRKAYDEALQWTEKALALEPKLAPAFLIRGLVLRAQNKLPEAEQNLRNAITLNLSDLRPRIAMAEIAETQNPQRAAVMYQDILSQNSELPRIRERYALVLSTGTDQMEQAEEQVNKVLAEQPESSIGHFCAAKVDAWFGRIEKSQQHLVQFSKLSPKSRRGEQLEVLLQMAAGDLKTASAKLANLESTANAAQKPVNSILRGVLQHSEGNRELAARTLQSALTLASPEMAQRIHFHLGLLELDNKQWSPAQAHFEKASSFAINLQSDRLDLEKLYGGGPENGQSNNSLGTLFLVERLLVPARDCFRKGLLAYPPDALALVMGSSTAARQLQFDDAARQLAVLANLVPDYWPAYFSAGLVELSRKDYPASATFFEKAIALNPTHVDSYSRLISLYRYMEKSGEVETVCSKLIENVPDSPIGYHELAVQLILNQKLESSDTEWPRDRQKELQQALEMARMAVEIDSKVGGYLDTLGWVLFLNGSYEESVQPLRDADKFLPNNIGVHYHLGAALVKTGKLKEAESYLLSATNAAAESVIAREAKRLLDEVRKGSAN